LVQLVVQLWCSCGAAWCSPAVYFWTAPALKPAWQGGLKVIGAVVQREKCSTDREKGKFLPWILGENS